MLKYLGTGLAAMAASVFYIFTHNAIVTLFLNSAEIKKIIPLWKITITA